MGSYKSSFNPFSYFSIKLIKKKFSEKWSQLCQATAPGQQGHQAPAGSA